MNGFVIQLLCVCGRRYYSTCKGDFSPVEKIEDAEKFYYAHQAKKAADELMKTTLGKEYVVVYRIVSL